MVVGPEDDPDLLPHDQLIAELRSLCAAKRTGILFIITTENHPAQIVLREGDIVGLSYRLMRGPDALAPMRIFGAARYRFQAESVQPTDQRLPPTAEVLDLLLPESGATEERPQPQTPADTSGTAGRLRPLIERELAEFLGPMAGLICHEYLADRAIPNSSQAVSRLVEAIAKEIGDPAKEAHFKQRVLSQLTAG